MPDVRKHTTSELRRELARREQEEREAAEYAPKRTVLLRTLKAIEECIANPPGGSIYENQLQEAAKLLFELSYRCLPGGDLDGSTGMTRGWVAVGETIDSMGRHSEETLEALVALTGVEVGPESRAVIRDSLVQRYARTVPRRRTAAR